MLESICVDISENVIGKHQGTDLLDLLIVEIMKNVRMAWRMIPVETREKGQYLPQMSSRNLSNLDLKLRPHYIEVWIQKMETDQKNEWVSQDNQ